MQVNFGFIKFEYLNYLSLSVKIKEFNKSRFVYNINVYKIKGCNGILFSSKNSLRS